MTTPNDARGSLAGDLDYLAEATLGRFPRALEYDLERLIRNWGTLLGEGIGAVSRPLELIGTTLVVIATTSRTSDMLASRTRAILNALPLRVAGVRIRRLDVRVEGQP